MGTVRRDSIRTSPTIPLPELIYRTFVIDEYLPLKINLSTTPLSIASGTLHKIGLFWHHRLAQAYASPRFPFRSAARRRTFTFPINLPSMYV